MERKKRNGGKKMICKKKEIEKNDYRILRKRKKDLMIEKDIEKKENIEF